VHRPAGKDHSAVLAFSSELDEWLDSRPVRQAMHPGLAQNSLAEVAGPDLQALVSRTEAMLERLDTLLARNDQVHRQLSELLLGLAEERVRRELRSNHRSRRAEAGAAA
jgi:hypothetical protein